MAMDLTSPFKLLSVSKPASTTWQITLNAPPDNRLSTPMLGEIGRALDRIEYEWRQTTEQARREKKDKLPAGAVVFASALPKFFSNGLDFVNSIKDNQFHWRVYSPVINRLLHYPLVTVAALNGHTFAGAFLLSLACDFRIMTNGRAWACMNEVDFGAAFPPQFGALLAHHITDRQVLRSVALGKRFTPPELLAAKIVDETVEPGRILARAIEVGQEEGGKVGLGSWGGIRCGLFAEVIEAGRKQQMPSMPYQVEADFYKRLELNGIRRDAKL